MSDTTTPSVHAETIQNAVAPHQDALRNHIYRDGGQNGGQIKIADQHWSRVQGKVETEVKNVAVELEKAMNAHHEGVHDSLNKAKEALVKGLDGKPKDEIAKAVREFDTEAAKVLQSHAQDVKDFRAHITGNLKDQKFSFKEPAKLFQVDATIGERIGANWKHAKVKTSLGGLAVAGSLLHGASELLGGGPVDPETKEKTGPRLGVIVVDGLIAAGGAWAMLHGGRNNFAKGLAG